jgi:processive 1,2-diacylglycerol beta-glucosyltransferase
MDKKAQRRALGLDENKCTVTLMDGGYGVGKTLKIVEKLVELDLPLNVIAICGNNEKSKNALSALKTGEKLTLKVEGQCNALTYLAASDVLVGKSGASTVAEATYFGCAIIVSKYATTIERDNAKYYEETVQNALKIFNVDEIAKTLQFWCEDDEELKLLQANARKAHGEYGSEKTADLLFAFLQEKFPHLREIKV